jgi:cytochrome c oxidase subunit 2
MNGKIIPDSHVDRVMNGKAGTAMQAFRNSLSDVDLAAIITYERNSLRQPEGRHDPARPDQGPSLGGDP